MGVRRSWGGLATRRAIGGLLASATVLAVGSAPGAAHAQEGKALAEALFRDARELLAAGKVHEACTKFASSQRIEPKLGTLLNLASCYETEGKTASAWADFTEATVIASRAGQPEREHFAREHAEALAARLSRITISSAEQLELTVRIDGVTVDAAAVGTPFPIDPGEHTLAVSSRGKQPWSTKITVPPGPAVTAVAIPALLAEAAPQQAKPSAVPAAAAAQPASPSRTASTVPAHRPSDTRAVGWIVLGAGVFGLGMGTFFGIRAFDKKADAEDGRCDEIGGRLECDGHGDLLLDDSETSAHASTVAFAAGAVAVGVGVYLLLRKPAGSAAHSIRLPGRPRIGARGVSIAW